MQALKKRKIEIWLLVSYTLILFSFMLKTMEDFRVIISFIIIYLLLPISIIYIFISKYFLFNREFIVELPFIYLLFIAFIGAGYVASLNGIISSQEIIYYKGVVKDKCIYGGKTKNHVVNLKLKNNEEKKFYISKEEYNNVVIGQSYQVSLKKGGLGIIYETKIKKE